MIQPARIGQELGGDVVSIRERRMRVAIDELRRRALPLVVKHEWASMRTDDGVVVMACPECRGAPEDSTPGHRPGCEWGAIVAGARKMMGGT